jgi:hypothetical protein
MLFQDWPALIVNNENFVANEIEKRLQLYRAVRDDVHTKNIPPTVPSPPAPTTSAINQTHAVSSVQTILSQNTADDNNTEFCVAVTFVANQDQATAIARRIRDCLQDSPIATDIRLRRNPK